MGSLRSLRRKSGLEASFQPSPVNQSDPRQLGQDVITACLSWNWHEAERLLNLGADPNFVDPVRNSTILEVALGWNATIDVIKLLLKKGAAVGKNPDALLVTCSQHQVGKTELLLKYGADPNVRDAHGRTPLMRSLTGYGTRFIRPLVKHGSDLNAVDNDGRTALMVAAEKDNTDAVRDLLKCGADPYIKDNDGKTAMDHANKSRWVVKTFEEAGIEV